MDMNRNADLDPRPDGRLIELFSALGHVHDLLAELVVARPARFLERDHAAGRVFSDRSTAVGGRCRSGAGGARLRPREWSRQCQRDAEYGLFHIVSLFFFRFPVNANAGRQTPRSRSRFTLLSYFESDGSFGPFVRSYLLGPAISASKADEYYPCAFVYDETAIGIALHFIKRSPFPRRGQAPSIRDIERVLRETNKVDAVNGLLPDRVKRMTLICAISGWRWFHQIKSQMMTIKFLGGADPRHGDIARSHLKSIGLVG